MHEGSLAAAPAADAAVSATASFLDMIFPPPRRFAIRLWEGTELPAEGPPRFTLALRSRSSLRRMFRPPVELSLGEAYLRGDFDVEGDIIPAFSLAPAARASLGSGATVLRLLPLWLSLPAEDGGSLFATRAPVRLSGEVHSRDRDRAAIQYHYDVGNDFYRLFLDRRMVYSCAYFRTGEESIDEAQEAKLEHICRKLRLREGDRLLDIGCGWGGLLIYAAERHGVEGVGVTLSREQHALARERVAEAGLEARVSIELRDYRDLEGEGFDRVSSVGMFEHVGRERMPEYFAHVHRLLKPGGLFLNHAISNRPARRRGRVSRALDDALVGNYHFRTRYIFPDGELVPVSEANLAAQTAGFEVRDVENLREHYARTLRHWLSRLRAHRDQAIALAGEPMFRLWEMYLAGSIYHFETAQVAIHQSLLARPLPDGKVPLPWTREGLYRDG
jgi:cyclopropane-fatty-acyl-phospholipid synthase